MRFKSLGSGSTGNALVVESKGSGGNTTRVLIDCGFTQKEITARLAQAGLTPDDLSGIFITHEHTDHMGCAFKFAKRWNLPLWMSEGTALGVEDAKGSQIQFVTDATPFKVGCLRLTPFTVPHDAREPLQVRIDDGRRHLGIVTDFGQATDYLIQNIYKCHALVLEANHDSQMLARSKYPAFLKKRVAGAYGHLSNQGAIDVLHEVMHSEMQHVVAAHLSQQNNLPELVAQIFASQIKCAPEQVCVANALSGTPWLHIL